jgi:hypothetical protein
MCGKRKRVNSYQMCEVKEGEPIASRGMHMWGKRRRDTNKGITHQLEKDLKH